MDDKVDLMESVPSTWVDNDDYDNYLEERWMGK